MEFTNDWFGTTANQPIWDALLKQIKPKKCLEIGSFEGRSAVFVLERLPDDATLTCVDTWEGGHDLSKADMAGVERRFDANVALARKLPGQVRKVRKTSHLALAQFLMNGERFDFIYIDGSHTAPDVLTDAVMAARLLTVQGVMIFDDYLWTMPDRADVLNAPGIAIDMFATLFTRSFVTLALGGQRVFQKIAEI